MKPQASQNYSLPKQVAFIAKAISQTNATAYLVGGILRDSILKVPNPDIDIAVVGNARNVGNEIANTTNNQSLKFFKTDLSKIKSIKALSDEIKTEYDSIEILVNNAGAYFSDYIQTEEGLEMTFALNHLNYFRLTLLLMDIMKSDQPGRVINVASSAHFGAKLDIDDIQMTKGYKGWTAYCNSKLMNILFTYEIHKRYKDLGITFNCLHPGFVDTSFGDNNTGLGKKILTIGKKLIAINVIKGASTSVYLASSNEVKIVSGEFFDKS